MSDNSGICKIYEDQHTALISGPVDTDMHGNFMDVIAAFNKSDIPTTLYFSTTGGDIYTALAIYDLIKLCPVPINIVANGDVMSAGTLIMQAATIRYATPSSQLLIHFGSESSDSAAELKHLREVEKYWLQRFVERTGKSMRTVRKWHSGEKYFNAKQALHDGLIDEIIGGSK